MTQALPFGRRAARLRMLAAISALLLATACDGSDRLGPLDTNDLAIAADEGSVGAGTPLTDAQLEANERLGEPGFVTGNTKPGIAFGPYNLPASKFGATYTGSVKAVGPGDVLATLAAAQRTGTRVLVRLSAGDRYWQNADRTVSLDKWKSQVARFRSINLEPYIKDGTLLGHMLVDEPHDPSNWGGQPVPFATLEAMAKYSKQLWPGLTTVVRSYSDWLSKATFRWNYLDATLAQYTASKGDVSTWLKNQASFAKDEKLGLLVGLNLLNGGNKESNLAGLYEGKYAISAAQLRTWGTLLATHSQSCAWFSWGWEETYFGRSDIKSALDELASKAKTRNRQSCRYSGEQLPPVTENPPPVTETPPVEETPPPVTETPPPVAETPPPVAETPPPVAETPPPPVTNTPPPVTNNPPTLPSGPASNLVLRVAGQLRNKVQYMTLTWTGAKGAMVDVYRDGRPHLTTDNDGRYVNTRRRQERTTYTYKVCERGSSTCSKSIRITVR
jgi:hypothetical protein